MPKKKPIAGFTLIEMLMAIVLMGIIATVTAVTMYQGVRAFHQTGTRNDLTEEARLAIDRLSKELMLTRCTQAGAACAAQAADITRMLVNDMRFVNIENAGRGFRVNAGSLMMRSGVLDADPEETLAGNVSALSFTYLDRNGGVAAVVSDVWLIGVNITLSNLGETLDFTVNINPRTFR
ncbi:MAG: type II secretion system protein [Deltaproteobacteria bacterium]|nr:type II secretion system protein [Deltaproteobacteria bacterium]